MNPIDNYVKEIQEAINKDYSKNYPNIPVPKIEKSEGKKFTKILRTVTVDNKIISKSVHCFVEKETGDIYKAATFNAPAKGVRGNIANEKKPLMGYEFYR